MRQHHEVEGRRVPFFMVPDVPDLGSEKTNLDELFVAIDRCTKEHGLPHPRVLALDTVARCMGAGDENAARDMGRLITRCGEIERRYSCLVAAVHHTGKDAERGGRGSNALNGAADVTWKVERVDGMSRVTVEEIKDGPSGASWTFRLLPFEITTQQPRNNICNNENREIFPKATFEAETCVVDLLSEPGFATKSATKPKARPTGVPGDLFKVIKVAFDEAGVLDHDSTLAPSGARVVSRKMVETYCATMAWQDKEGNMHSFRTVFARSMSTLRAKELIGFDRNWVWLT
jgi:AAA domain